MFWVLMILRQEIYLLCVEIASGLWVKTLWGGLWLQWCMVVVVVVMDFTHCGDDQVFCCCSMMTRRSNAGKSLCWDSMRYPTGYDESFAYRIDVEGFACRQNQANAQFKSLYSQYVIHEAAQECDEGALCWTTEKRVPHTCVYSLRDGLPSAWGWPLICFSYTKKGTPPQSKGCLAGSSSSVSPDCPSNNTTNLYGFTRTQTIHTHTHKEIKEKGREKRKRINNWLKTLSSFGSIINWIWERKKMC